MANLTCCICGENGGNFRQHWNRDTGYGACTACIKELLDAGRTTWREVLDLYGKPNINFAWPYPVPLDAPVAP